MSNHSSPDGPAHGGPYPPSGPPWPPAPGAVTGRRGGLSRLASKVIAVALSLLLTLTGLGVLAWAARSSADVLGLEPGDGAPTPQAAVQRYLQAIADADSRRAIALLAEVPDDRRLLTDDVLRRSKEMAPITVVSVDEPHQNPDGQQRVRVALLMGDAPLDVEVHATRVAGEWRVADAPARLYLSVGRSPLVKASVNGVALPRNTVVVPAFTGTYQLEMDNPNVRFTPPARLVVRGAGEAPVIGGIDVELTDHGRTEALAAVRAQLDDCLARRELQPDQCPQSIRANAAEPAVAGTARWSLATNPYPSAAVDLNTTTGIATVTLEVTWSLQVDVQPGSGQVRTVTHSYSQATRWAVDLSPEAERPVAVYQP